jgi:hypothetical protein
MSDSCFFICPLGEPGSPQRRRSDTVLRHIVTHAAVRNGLTIVRSDEGPPGMITQQIIQHILDDRMVVADLSDNNANVFYELALRHAFRKPVVQLIEQGQKIPFDVHGTRTIFYNLADLDAVEEARTSVSKQIADALQEGFHPQSPVTIAAQLEDLTRGAPPGNELRMDTILARFDQVERAVSDIGRRFQPSEHLKEALPPFIRDQLSDIIRGYAEEISLLKSVRHAGVTGIFKRRETALRAFASAIDEEATEIMVVASSLKGFLHKEEYKDIAEKIRFKADSGLVRVKFLLTHPVVADFRARQENRGFTEIGEEIISSLRILKKWPQKECETRLYLGTPTCFAIKTTRKMLINPYPYVSVSYDSPCLILEYSPEGGAERPAYFFDEFKTSHFGAWDTNLAVPVEDYDKAVAHYSAELQAYANRVKEILSSD